MSLIKCDLCTGVAGKVFNRQLSEVEHRLEREIEHCIKKDQEIQKLRELAVKLLESGFTGITFSTEETNLIDELIGVQGWNN